MPPASSRRWPVKDKEHRDGSRIDVFNFYGSAHGGGGGGVGWWCPGRRYRRELIVVGPIVLVLSAIAKLATGDVASTSHVRVATTRAERIPGNKVVMKRVDAEPFPVYMHRIYRSFRVRRHHREVIAGGSRHLGSGQVLRFGEELAFAVQHLDQVLPLRLVVGYDNPFLADRILLPDLDKVTRLRDPIGL